MISIIITKLRYNFFPSEAHDRMVKKMVCWWSDDSFRFHLQSHPRLSGLDLGGYQGQWASDIFLEILRKIIIFEPVSEYAQQISKRFAQ